MKTSKNIPTVVRSLPSLHFQMDSGDEAIIREQTERVPGTDEEPLRHADLVRQRVIQYDWRLS